MLVKYSSPEEQPRDLLSFLGVSKTTLGRRYILACFIEISSGCEPGIEIYEHVAMLHKTTAAQMVKNSQCALVRAQQVRPREWEAVFPRLNMGQEGLTLFLRHATAWLRHNKIGHFRLDGMKYYVLENKDGQNLC